MKQETREKVTQFERDHAVRIEAHESYEHPVYWEVTVWMTATADYTKMTGKPDIPRVWGRKYLTTPTAGGQVLVIRNPQRSEAFSVESWGAIDSYDAFVGEVLDRVRSEPLEEDFTSLCQECGYEIPSL